MPGNSAPALNTASIFNSLRFIDERACAEKATVSELALTGIVCGAAALATLGATAGRIGDVFKVVSMLIKRQHHWLAHELYQYIMYCANKYIAGIRRPLHTYGSHQSSASCTDFQRNVAVITGGRSNTSSRVM